MPGVSSRSTIRISSRTNGGSWSLLWERREFPYGDMRIDTGAAGTERFFTGQVEDADSSLYFYNARYLETGIGRFISPDSIVPNPSDPRDHNRYTYVRNNPLKYTDRSGNCVILMGLSSECFTGFSAAQNTCISERSTQNSPPAEVQLVADLTVIVSAIAQAVNTGTKLGEIVNSVVNSDTYSVSIEPKEGFGALFVKTGEKRTIKVGLADRTEDILAGNVAHEFGHAGIDAIVGSHSISAEEEVVLSNQGNLVRGTVPGGTSPDPRDNSDPRQLLSGMSTAWGFIDFKIRFFADREAAKILHR